MLACRDMSALCYATASRASFYCVFTIQPILSTPRCHTAHKIQSFEFEYPVKLLNVIVVKVLAPVSQWATVLSLDMSHYYCFKRKTTSSFRQLCWCSGAECPAEVKREGSLASRWKAATNSDYVKGVKGFILLLFQSYCVQKMIIASKLSRAAKSIIRGVKQCLGVRSAFKLNFLVFSFYLLIDTCSDAPKQPCAFFFFFFFFFLNHWHKKMISFGKSSTLKCWLLPTQRGFLNNDHSRGRESCLEQCLIIFLI